MPSRWKIVAVRSPPRIGSVAGVGAVLVAGADHLSAADPSADHRETKNVPPVVAPAELVDLRRAAELTDYHNKGFLQ